MKKTKKVLQVFSQFGQSITFVIIGTLLVSCFVQLLSFSLLASTGRIEVRGDELLNVMSLQMAPELIVYALFIGIIYFLFRKNKQKISVVNEAEIEKVREEAVIQTLQKTAGMIAENIATHNAEIKRWIEAKKEKGQAPAQVELACQRIGATLQLLSWAGYVFPYVDSENRKPEDYTRFIEYGLKKLAPVRVEQIEDRR